MSDSAKRLFSVSVRALVEFVLRSGDLAGDRDFFRPSRALEGTREHQRLQKNRPANYQAEVPVSFRIETDRVSLTIKGRVDGILCAGETILIEEIKTTVGCAEHTPDPLHWAQAKVYAFIYLREHSAARVEIQLTYADLETGLVTRHTQAVGMAELSEHFDALVAVYLCWLDEHAQWCDLRDDSIRSANFPFGEYRPGQRRLAVAAYRALVAGGRLFAEAPTGIGKTVSMLFPAVKAFGEGHVSKIFYLTAKTVARAVAEKALADMRASSGLRFRSLTLTAKQEFCVLNGQPCDRRTCPLALGYYDRVKGALRELLAQESLTRPVLERIAQRHRVCPFALALDAAPWVDAIICDYNHVFDPQACLKQFFDDASGEYAFLIDEAHNLVERARDMFSADLDQQAILELERALDPEIPRCAKTLRSLSRRLRGLFKAGAGESQPREGEGIVLNQFPAELLPPLREFLEEAEAWLAGAVNAPFRQALLEFYFAALAFLRIAESSHEGYGILLRSFGRHVSLRLFCLDPARFLRQALERGKAALFFSATLRPMDYFRTTLGADAADTVLELPSPFPPENFAVLIEDQIATHFRARETTLDRVARAIAAAIQPRTGNYLAYFPSYQYLHAVLERFRTLPFEGELLVQESGMTDERRRAFLDAFHAARDRTLLGFAVMGGMFGEGIDLIGERLVGAIVVGVGLPQVCLERELIRNYFQERNGMGFEYAYVYPGMNRVLQAVGRVIRSESDRGVALLIDARFRQSQYRDLLPRWWAVRTARGDAEIGSAINDFWSAPAADAECVGGSTN